MTIQQYASFDVEAAGPKATSKSNPAVAKMVAAWENKNAKRAMQGSGLALMAMSLTACGGSSTTTTTAATTTTTTTTTVAAAAPEATALTISNDTVVGTTATTTVTNNDSVTAARIDTVQTFNSGDKIDLGEGTDSFSATLNAGTVTPASLTGVENITFTSLGTATATVDFDNATDVISITSLGSTAALTVDDIQALTTSITVQNNTAAQTFTFKAAAVVGTTDTMTLNLDGVGGVVTVGGEGDTDGSIETFAIVATGGASDLGVGNGFAADATTITVNASATLDLGSTAQFLESTNFDASASSASVTAVFATRTAASETAVSIKGGAGADNFDIGTFTIANYGDITVDMGAGNDILDLGAVADTDTGSSISGGTGTGDILIISGAALTAAVNSQISGFEILNIETNALTQDADNFAGTTFGTGAAIAALTVSDLADDSVLNVNHNMTTSITANIKTDTASDAVTVNIGGTAGNLTLASLIPSTTYESVTVNSQGTAANTLTAVGAVINNMTFTGATALTVASTNNITGVVDFTASTAANTVTVTDTTDQTISFGSGADTLTATGVVTTGQTQIINGGAGNDSITVGDLAAGATVTVNGEAGSDTITYNAANTGASIHNINGGAGIDFITLGQDAATLDDVISTATVTADADEVTGFVTTVDDFDYNGTLSNDGITAAVAVSNATFAGGLAADPNATVFIHSTALTGAAATDMTALVAETAAAGVITDYATFEASLVANLGTIAGLDSTLSATESVLLNVDDGTNSVILRITNTDTSTANTLTVAEVELVAVMVAADDLVTGDFI